MYVILIWGLLVIVYLGLFPHSLKRNIKIHRFLYAILLLSTIPAIYILLFVLHWLWAGNGNLNLIFVPITFFLFFIFAYVLTVKFLSKHYFNILGFNIRFVEHILAIFFSIYVSFGMTLLSLNILYWLMNKKMEIT